VIPNTINHIEWNGSVWLIGGIGTNVIVYSSNGIDWTASTPITSTVPIQCNTIGWNGSVWVAGFQGVSDNIISFVIGYSYDGITWIESTSANSIFTFGCARITWNGSLWIAGGGETNRIAYSYDGISWIPSSSGNILFSGFGLSLASRRVLPYVGTGLKYIPAVPSNWTSPAPTTIANALDRIAAALAAMDVFP
jgi:hypothetical protein